MIQRTRYKESKNDTERRGRESKSSIKRRVPGFQASTFFPFVDYPYINTSFPAESIKRPSYPTSTSFILLARSRTYPLLQPVASTECQQTTNILSQRHGKHISVIYIPAHLSHTFDQTLTFMSTPKIPNQIAPPPYKTKGKCKANAGEATTEQTALVPITASTKALFRNTANSRMDMI